MKPGQFAIFAILGLLVCALVGGASGWAVARHRVPEIVTPAPKPTPHLMGAVEPPSASWYANELGAGRFWVNNPKFVGGAVGDFVHDDTAAIVATDAAAAAAGGSVHFQIPPTAYLTASTLTASPSVSWICESVVPEQCSIKANATMAAVVVLHNTTGASVHDPKPNLFRGLTLDGNGLATSPVLGLGTFEGTFDHVFFYRGLVNGERLANHRMPLILSAATCTGTCSTSLPTVSQPDLNFAALLTARVYTYRAKIADPGALQTGTYQLSQDDGASYATAKQFVAAQSNVNLTSGARYGAPLGVRLGFAAGSYTTSDYYRWTVTVQSEDFGLGETINADNRYHDCDWSENGTVYGTAGLIGNYAGFGRSTVTTSGTVAVNAGSQVFTGTTTSFVTSINPQEGDMWLVNGQLFQNVSALDDLHFVVAFANAPTFTLSGLDYAVGHGSGYHEDGAAEGIRNIFYDGTASQNASSDFRFAGSQGPLVVQTRNESYGMSAYAFGGTVINMTGSPLMIHPHVESGAANSKSIFSIAEAPVSGLEPPQFYTNSGPGGGFKSINGVQFGVNNGASTLVPIYSERFVLSTVTLSTGAETIPAPATETLGGTSFVYLTPTANITMTSVPTVSPPVTDGQVLKLINTSANFGITFGANAETSSGIFTTQRYVELGSVGSIELISFNLLGTLHWMQRMPEAQTFASATGNGTAASMRTMITTDASTHVIWDFNVVNSGVSSGTTAIWDLVAQSQSGVNLCSWVGYHAIWDASHTLVGFGAGDKFGNGPSGGCPLISGNTWAQTLGFDGPNQYSQIRIAGDSSGSPVAWKIAMRHLSPPR